MGVQCRCIGREQNTDPVALHFLSLAGRLNSVNWRR